MARKSARMMNISLLQRRRRMIGTFCKLGTTVSDPDRSRERVVCLGVHHLPLLCWICCVPRLGSQMHSDRLANVILAPPSMRLNVVNAVFVQSTMKASRSAAKQAQMPFSLRGSEGWLHKSESSEVAAADEEVMAREKRKAELAFQRKVSALFRQADISGDGKIDVKEFKRLLKAPKLQSLPRR